jgi:hypothetical protein
METANKKRIWTNENDWERTLKNILGTQATLLFGCQKIQAPFEDSRLTLSTTSKASRRLLLQEIKKNRNGVKASVLLTPLERANKALAYRLLHKKKVHVKDLGDMMTLTPIGQPTPAPHNVHLDTQPDQVEGEILQVIEQAN